MWQREGDRLEARQRWSSAVCSVDHTEQSNARGLLQKVIREEAACTYSCHCGDLWASQLHQRRAQHIFKGLMAIMRKKRQAVTLKAVMDTNAITTFRFVIVNETFAAQITWCLDCLIILNGCSTGEVKPCRGLASQQLPNVIRVPPADPAHSCSQMLWKLIVATWRAASKSIITGSIRSQSLTLWPACSANSRYGHFNNTDVFPLILKDFKWWMRD